jgi:hypothetical protein
MLLTLNSLTGIDFCQIKLGNKNERILIQKIRQVKVKLRMIRSDFYYVDPGNTHSWAANPIILFPRSLFQYSISQQQVEQRSGLHLSY